MQHFKTVKIKIWGIVQGVGFRPFIAKLADRYDMKGEVLNIGGLVDIVTTDKEDRIQSFIEAIKREKPIPAEIVHIKVEELDYTIFDCFKILESEYGDDEAAMIPADLAICNDCLSEMKNKENPRHMHPFISCMVCGPRYSIIDSIPYDRKNTSMIDFEMCNFCEKEYTSIKDRRYHAQTISCNDCGPMIETRLSNYGNAASAYGIIGFDVDEKVAEKVLLPISMASSFIEEGKVIAVKGVGGYNFICSPFIEEAVMNLRKLKNREEKPLAVMFRDIEQIKEYCYVSREEENLLNSSPRPILLLERKNSMICEAVYKTSRYIGAFLPSIAMQYLLIDICDPIVVTSANISDMPIIKDDEKMFALQDKIDQDKEKKDILAAVFYNKRKIRIRLDDSVVRVIDKQPQMIRRSKGYAPVPLYVNEKNSKDDMIFATGGQLKSAFSISKGPFAYISQYLGDLDGVEACEIYKDNFERMKSLFRIKPKLVVCDLHPLYFTTDFAKEYCQNNNLELMLVQHHQAHVASVIAEHDIKEPVIGVSFDGTGYGTDGAIWGGEFFSYEKNEFNRENHLEYVKMLGGDSSMKEGWKSSFSYIHHYKDLFDLEEPKDSRWQLVKAGLDNNVNTINSSSMGRLFDAFSSLIGIHDYNRYEGECAIILENYAAAALENKIKPFEMGFLIGNTISAGTILKSAQEAITLGISKESIALGFHYAVAQMILDVCKNLRNKRNINNVVLTGGVFQNKILMERSLELLRKDEFKVYYNISVGPNDGGICLGQNYLGMKYLLKKNSNI